MKILIEGKKYSLDYGLSPKSLISFLMQEKSNEVYVSRSLLGSASIDFPGRVSEDSIPNYTQKYLFTSFKDLEKYDLSKYDYFCFDEDFLRQRCWTEEQALNLMKSKLEGRISSDMVISNYIKGTKSFILPEPSKYQFDYSLVVTDPFEFQVETLDKVSGKGLVIGRLDEDKLKELEDYLEKNNRKDIFYSPQLLETSHLWEQVRDSKKIVIQIGEESNQWFIRTCLNSIAILDKEKFFYGPLKSNLFPQLKELSF